MQIYPNIIQLFSTEYNLNCSGCTSFRALPKLLETAISSFSCWNSSSESVLPEDLRNEITIWNIMSNLRNKIIIESNHVKPVTELRNHTSRVDVFEELLILLDDQRVQVFLKCLEPGVVYKKRVMGCDTA